MAEKSIHPLGKKYGAGLVSRDGYVVEMLNDFYNDVKEALDTFAIEVKKASAADKGLKPVVRAERQQVIIDAARAECHAEIEQAIQVKRVNVSDIEERLADSLKPEKPKTQISQLLAFLKEKEMKDELRRMSGDGRHRAVCDLAGAGNQLIFGALSGTIDPLVNDHTIAAAKSAYLENNERPELNQLEIHKTVLRAAEATLLVLGSVMARVLTNEGLNPTETRQIPKAKTYEEWKADNEEYGYKASAKWLKKGERDKAPKLSQ